MKHIILVIFDSTKYSHSPEIIKLVESSFAKIEFNDNFSIFYLKLVTEKEETPHDILYQITPDSGNPLSPMRNNFDFTNAKSLQNSIEYIKPAEKEETKYYLISLGHGAGFGFFKRDTKGNMSSPCRFVESCSIVHEANPGFEILWNIEFFQAFRNIKFELAIFNNCHVTLLENCTMFSRSVKYLIATENYLSIDMLNLNGMLKKLIIRIRVESLPEKIGQVIYDDYLISILQRVTKNSHNIDETSLFYINLENFNEHFYNFEKIILGLLDIIDKNPGWIKEIRKKQGRVSTSLKIIDLIEFLENLRMDDDNIVSENIKSEINWLLNSIDKSIISKWTHKNEKKYNGISLYFPDIEGFEHDEIYIFNRNILCAAGILKPSNWDKLLDKVSITPQNKK